MEADCRSDFEADRRSDFEVARKVPFLVKNACVVGGSFFAGAIETLLDLTFFPGSVQIHEKLPNRSFSNKETAFSPCLRIFDFWNFLKLAGDGGVGRAGFSGRGGVIPPGPPRDPPGRGGVKA